MPNQRKKGKKKVGIWMTPEEREAAKVLAAKLKISVSDLMKREIVRYIEKN